MAPPTTSSAEYGGPTERRNAHKLSRREDARTNRRLRIGEDAAHLEGGGRGVNLVVDEVHASLERETLLRGEAQGDRDFLALFAGRRQLAFADELPDVLDSRLVHIEVGVHGIKRNDGGESGLIGNDQIAFGDESAANLPSDWRRNAGKVHVELSGVTRGAGGNDAGFRLREIGLILNKSGLGRCRWRGLIALERIQLALAVPPWPDSNWPSFDSIRPGRSADQSCTAPLLS